MTILEFCCGSGEAADLEAADDAMGWLIRSVGEVTIDLRADRFKALARSIVGQQLSVKAARTIWERLETALGEAAPDRIIDAPDAALRAAGLSGAKGRYIKALAEEVRSERLDLEDLDALSDEGAIARLVQLKGVGRWTAEMFLIFSLGRLDVFALDDAGLRRAVAWLYGGNVAEDRGLMSTLAAGWAPYRSVASLYLWEAIDRGLIARPAHELTCGAPEGVVKA